MISKYLILSSFTFIFTFLTNSVGHAFPEMVRHHYVNCSACHVNANGGGVLNAYGRTISYEVLSTWGTEKEARAFYFIDPEKVGAWLNLGGDLRAIQVHQENSSLKRGRFFWMQGSLDVAATIKNLTAFITVGEVNTQTQTWSSKIPRYFVSYQVTDELSVRAGRFVPIFGLNIPQHQYYIRDHLQLAPGFERVAADIQWNGEQFNFLLGYATTAAESIGQSGEKASNAQVQTTLADAYKFGLSFWSGNSNFERRSIVGVNAVLGWTEKFYTLTEFDQLTAAPAGTSNETRTLIEFLKFGYEFIKGAHFQIVQELKRPDAEVTTADATSYGAGFLFFPRPHFELEGLWTKRQPSLGNREDYAYLITHYYF
ncbi:MAG: hypothetical protein H7061_05405 [Bdellovibrionaceae bacterium]|nr:hypothetical protein [Bdellovibrio sp.]